MHCPFTNEDSSSKSFLILQDVRRQLYGDDDYKNFFEWILDEIKHINKKLEAGSAVLHHLEMFLMNVACNDPGAAIGANLVLPILQDRLDALALEFAAEKAAEAEKAIIKMEVCTACFKHLSSCVPVCSCLLLH